jgi:hypothetical protein
MITKRMSDVLKLLRRLAITHTLSLCPFDGVLHIEEKMLQVTKW